jgi:hypothetical protein
MKQPALRKALSVLALACGLALASASQVGAIGALALGVPDDVAKDGVSLDVQTNEPTAESARKKAIEQCRMHGSKKSKAMCVVVRVFRNQCVALSTDPEPGTPGFGWAVADGPDQAREEALAGCKRTAGPTRRDACKVGEPHCDKTDR